MFTPDDSEKVVRNYPIPAVVLPKEWSIIDSSTPAVDIAGGRMQVPLGNHSKDMAMRLHEMMHVKISPESKEKLRLSKNTIMPVSAIEDYRVNSVIAPHRLRNMSYYSHRDWTGEKQMYTSADNLPDGIRTESIITYLEDAVAVSKAERIDAEHRALGVLSAGPTVVQCYDAVENWARNKRNGITSQTWEEYWDENKVIDDSPCNVLHKDGIDPKGVHDAVKKVCKDMFPVSERCRQMAEDFMVRVGNHISCNPTFKNVMKQGRLWAKNFKLWKEQEETERKVQHELANQANQTPGIGNEHQLAVQQGMEEMMSRLSQQITDNNQRRRRGVPRFDKTADIPIDEALEGIDFEIKTLPLEIYKPSVLSRKKRPEFIGAVPKHMERLPFDGQVFERKMRGLGGSVVIDNSGSMSLSKQELETLVRKAPAVTVAAYSGERGGQYGGGHGVLYLLAAHGRMADLEPLDRVGGLNIVDVHSLRWLGKQQPPRIWVSDGGVTGKNHEHYRSVVQECVVLCLQHGIIRVPSVKAALDLFSNEAVFSERGRAMTREKLRYQHEEGGGIL